MNEHYLLNLENILGTCFMPRISEDCINVQEYYQEYIEVLDRQLPNILRILYWMEGASIKTMKGLPLTTLSRLLLLLYELGNPKLPLKIPQEIAKRCQEIIEKLHQAELFTVLLEKEIFEYYRKHLDKDNWKREYGAMHGFQYYLTLQQRIQCPLLSLSLAIGLSIHNHHEIYYKNLSISICQDILEKSDSTVIVDMNIHFVIYDAFLNDLYLMDEPIFIYNVGNCLYKCIELFPNIVDSEKWSVIDDVMEIVLRNIMLTHRIDVVGHFLHFLNKLGLLLNENRNKIEQILMDVSIFELDMNQYDLFIPKDINYMPLRWTKRILEMLETQIGLCLQETANIHEIKSLLCLIIKCYMIYVLPIPLSVLEPLIIDFYTKFVKYLMGIGNRRRKDSQVMKIITCILETLLHHHEINRRSSVREDERMVSSPLENYQKSFQQLLLMAPFQEYSKTMRNQQQQQQQGGGGGGEAVIQMSH